jgi:tetratricopeptide (TPR) repeat protein
MRDRICCTALYRRLFMNASRGIIFILAASLLVISFNGTSAIAQQDEVNTLNERARVLSQAGKTSEAIPLAQRAGLREKALGPGDPNVAESLNILAFLYNNRGRYAEAESLRKRALAIREKAFGPDHPAVWQSLHTYPTTPRRPSRRALAASGPRTVSIESHTKVMSPEAYTATSMESCRSVPQTVWAETETKATVAGLELW